MARHTTQRLHSTTLSGWRVELNGMGGVTREGMEGEGCRSEGMEGEQEGLDGREGGRIEGKTSETTIYSM